MVVGRIATAKWRGMIAGGLALSLGAGPIGGAHAADLPPYPASPPRIIRAYPERPTPYADTNADPGPASASGYYGYYGTDIQGVPYGGLYSENVVCIRSVPTPYGYRTVYVC